jgi:hypothetical protein
VRRVAGEFTVVFEASVEIQTVSPREAGSGSASGKLHFHEKTLVIVCVIFA